jgi:hypothetical protein
MLLQELLQPRSPSAVVCCWRLLLLLLFVELPLVELMKLLLLLLLLLDAAGVWLRKRRAARCRRRCRDTQATTVVTRHPLQLRSWQVSSVAAGCGAASCCSQPSSMSHCETASA